MLKGLIFVYKYVFISYHIMSAYAKSLLNYNWNENSSNDVTAAGHLQCQMH